MESSNIQNIIRTFFEKNASKNTQFLFRKWFRLDEHEAEKGKAMEQLWDSSPLVISAQTLENLAKIKTQISAQTPAKPVYSLSRLLFSYAAVVALIIASSVYITYQFVAPQKLEYAQLSVSFGESKKITLADGSIVTVNAGSTLIYPKSFVSNTRTVFLTGEANFKVAKNPNKPFIVKTKYLDVRALGTKFNVQSYPNAVFTKATLIEGSVKVNMELDQNKSYILKPNDQLTYSHQDNNVNVSVVDAGKLSLWENGYLIFQGATFDEIASTIERKYNITINFDAHKINKQSFYVKFNPSESLEDVMNVLCQLMSNSNYTIKESTVYFCINN